MIATIRVPNSNKNETGEQGKNMNQTNGLDEALGPDVGTEWTTLPALADSENDTPPAWEEIANGRFMPRRIKGSYLGRELG